MNSTIINSIGNTPIWDLSSYSSNCHVKILAKMEKFNPSGSIKDRIAFYMFQEAERNKLLKKGDEIIEATSGNTGISLAFFSKIKGYKFTAVMPSDSTKERIKLLKAYGAKIILTDGEQGTNDSIKFLQELLKENTNKRFFNPDQFSNSMNIQAHYETTGPEILKQVPDITHFITGIGTGGTIVGISKRLKEFNPMIKITKIEIQKSSFYGLRNLDFFRPNIYQENNIDNKVSLDEEEIAFEIIKDLSKKRGILIGISSGVALWGAMEISKKIKKGKIVTIFPDGGEKYLSTGIFD